VNLRVWWPWKEHEARLTPKAPEFRIHGKVPDYVDGGCSALEAPAIEPVVHVEEPVAASRRLGHTISCPIKETVDDIGHKARFQKKCAPYFACHASSCINQTWGDHP
jgi:hypothetical protein